MCQSASQPASQPAGIVYHDQYLVTDGLQGYKGMPHKMAYCETTQFVSDIIGCTEEVDILDEALLRPTEATKVAGVFMIK